MSVLEVGSCQYLEQDTLRDIVPCKYLGIDIQDGPNIDMVVEPYHWPFEDESYNMILCCSVFEHCERFWLLFEEMARVLKLNGKMLITAPRIHFKTHRHPVDCWRFLPDGMRALGKLCENVKCVRARVKPNQCYGYFVKRKK